MKKQHFDELYHLTNENVEQLPQNWYMNSKVGDVILVRSNNVPDLGDHYIVVVGGLMAKEHGIRPKTLTITAGKNAYLLNVSKEPVTVLKLDNYHARVFLDHYGITIVGEYAGYSNLLVVEELLKAFDKFRMAPSIIDQYDSVGKEKIANRFLKFIDAKQPVKFSMLGYPFKSGNTRDKVIGHLPDAAEEKSIDNFAHFGRLFRQIYDEGSHFSIISDGYIFSDVFGVPDEKVLEYNETTRCMTKNAQITMYNGTDFYGHASPQLMREKVLLQYGITKEELAQRILSDLNVNELYRGMIIFMQEEFAMKEFPSNSQREKNAKIFAREAMIRNEAYSALIQEQFHDHIRLSMHNSTNDGTKYSIKLLEGDSKYSPWHSTLVVHKDGTFKTIHRKDAEAAGYELVNQNGRPYYFQEI